MQEYENKQEKQMLIHGIGIYGFLATAEVRANISANVKIRKAIWDIQICEFFLGSKMQIIELF